MRRTGKERGRGDREEGSKKLRAKFLKGQLHEISKRRLEKREGREIGRREARSYEQNF